MDSLLGCLCGLSDTDTAIPRPTHPYQYALIDSKPPIIEPPPHSQQLVPNTINKLNTNSNSNPDPNPDEDPDKDTILANKIISLLLTSPTTTAFHASLQDLRVTNPSSAPTPLSWTTTLAHRILTTLTKTISQLPPNGDRTSWPPLLNKTYTAALDLAESEFSALVRHAREHPLETGATVLVTLLALGVMAGVMPWVLRAVGFAGEGVVEGSWAALWQSRYAGWVPKGSVFSYLQRLGAVVGRGA